MDPLTTTQQQPGLSTVSPENKPSADIESSKYLPDASKAETGSETSLVSRKTELAPESLLKGAPLPLYVSKFAKDNMLLPAVLNTPATSSLLRPLVQSQQTGQLPKLTAALSTAGWAPAIARTVTRYAIADTVRTVSAQLLYGVSSTMELPEDTQGKANFAVNGTTATLMTVASQPFAAMQIKQQMRDRNVKKAQESKTILQRGFKRTLTSHFRGVTSNCLSALLMFSMDSMDRQQVKRRDEGKLGDFEMRATQFGVGATVGFINNILKTHANGRILGKTHQEIFRQLAATAAKNPKVFVAQLAYATAMGGVSNLMWSGTLQALTAAHEKVAGHYASKDES